MQTDVAIIGAGPVGLFSAFQAGMLGMESCVIDVLSTIGGQCGALYPEKPIYDIPGYPEILSQQLVDNLARQASAYNPSYLLSTQVTDIQQKQDIFVLTTSTGEVIQSKAVIIAAGAGCFGPNRPPMQNIELYEGKSVFYLVSRKEEMHGKRVIIAGGGDSAVDWALSLSAISDVTVVHRRAKFRASLANVRKLHELANIGKIKLITNFQLSELIGNNGYIEQVVISDLDGNRKALQADILLPFFGLVQNLGPLKECGLKIKRSHIVAEPPSYMTNIPGIYAVGDVAIYDGKLKLILTGFAESASALHHAYSRVFDGQALHFEYSTTKCKDIITN